MKRAIALMLVLTLLVFGLATTANALIVFGEDGPENVGVEGEDIAEDASDEEDPGVDGGEIADEATPDFDEGEFPAEPAESGGWMK